MDKNSLVQISANNERDLLFALCQDYKNYKKIHQYLDVNDFHVKEYQEIFILLKRIYDNSGYRNITSSSIESFCFEKNIDKKVFIGLASFVEFSQDNVIDFDGTYNQFRRLSGIQKMNEISEKYGGMDNLLYKIYNKYDTTDDIKKSIDNLTKSCFKTYKTSTRRVDLSSGMLDYVQNKMFYNDGQSIHFIHGHYLMEYYSKGIHIGVTFVGAQSGVGKSLTLTSKLYTKDGYILMKDVKIGDEIFGEDGKLHKVVGVFPQGKKQKVRITFSDNTFIDCCEDHLWSVYELTRRPKSSIRKLTPQEREDRWKTTTMSAKEMIKKGWIREGYDKQQDRPMFASKFRIPITKPVEFEGKEHYIDPYLLGVLIGDGCLVRDSVSISTNEEYIVDTVSKKLPLGYSIYKSAGKNYTYNITYENKYIPSKLKQEIHRLGLNVKSHEKFIPNEYKFDSVENRLALLRGIFDTDGSIRGARTTITTISPKLKDDIVWLCQSLGMTATVSDDIREKYVRNDRCYNISIQFNEGFEPFTSPKHSNRYTKPKRKQFVRRHITNIEYLDEYVEMQCISVDNPTKLYLTDNFIVTHNTSITIPFFGISILESGQKLLGVFNEQDESEIRQLFLFAYIARIKKDTKGLLRQNFNADGRKKITEEQYMYLCQCAKEFEERYEGRLEFVFIPRFNEYDLENLIEEYARLGYKNVLLDTFKQEDSEKGWEGMDNLAKKMDGLAKDLELKIVCTVQLSANTSWRKYLTVSCIGKAKSIKEVATSLWMFRWLRSEEIPNIKYSCFNRQGDKMIWTTDNQLQSTYKDSNGQTREKKYIAIFNDKQRKAECGQVIIYEADLGSMFFKEIGITNSIKNDDNGR